MLNLGQLAAQGAVATNGAADVDARDWNGSGSMISNVSKSGNQLIDGLLSGVRWNGPISYSAPNALSDYQSGYFNGFDTGGFSAFTSAQMTAFHFALKTSGPTAGFSVFGFTNLGVSFIGGGSGAGTIRGANMNDGNPTAYAFYPSNSIYGGDTFFGNNYASLKSPVAGNYAWHTMLHEIGHSLGLKHGHETGRIGGALPKNYDSLEYSIMTYRTFVGDTASGYKYEQWGAPQTYMMADIAALQRMYGADFTTNAGATTYKWNPNSGDTLVNGKVAIDAGGNRIFATIWDGGGSDTYDLTAYTNGLKISLAPGGHSVFSQTQLANLGGGPNGGFARGNIFNAMQHKNDPRSLIENAKGGAGNDSIVGNKANNALWGNNGNDKLYGQAGNDKLYGGNGTDILYGQAGNDMLYGGNGNDILYGGAGADKLYGGAGTDTVSYAGASAGVIANLASPRGNTGDARGDAYGSIENLTGTSHADRLTGNVLSNVINGGAGADHIYGGAGNDILIGGPGGDRLFGGTGTDTASYVTAKAGVTAKLSTPSGNKGDARGDTYSSIENLTGSSYGDRLYGNSGNNVIQGNNGNDYLYGGSGTDKLYGGNGNDYLYGGAGVDYLYGGAGNDYMLGHAGNDYLLGGAGTDRLYGQDGIDRLYGEAGNDFLYGGNDRDLLYGGAGNDMLRGDAGNDYLYGGDGDDSLYGGAGDDWLYGGNGTDYAHLGGASSGYSWSTSNGVTTVVNHSGSDGTDYLVGVEYIVFSDTIIVL